MTYIPGYIGPFFYGYNPSSVSGLGVGATIPVTTARNVGVSSGSLNLSTGGAYVVGETRTSGDGTTLQNLVDIKINQNTGELSEGYQVRNNAAGTMLMDDAAYGTVTTGSCTLVVAQANSSDLDSNAYETRILGVYI
jgi:hypothetical protein